MSDRKSSDARIKANAKYAAKTYKRFAVNTRLEHIEAIEVYKAKNSISSDSGIFNAALMYCIENDVDLSKYKKEN